MLEEQALVEAVGRKILDEAVGEQDFDAVFEVFARICNTDGILLFTLKGYTESFQFYFDEYSYGIIFENGSCRTVKGTISLPDVTFKIHKPVALAIINGQVYSAVAHMNGAVDYTGYKDGAIRFIGILESVLDGAAAAARKAAGAAKKEDLKTGIGKTAGEEGQP